MPTVYKVTSNDTSLKDLELPDWATWLTKEQRDIGHTELEELDSEGFGGDLMRHFAKSSIPSSLLTILTLGGHDVLGGYVLSLVLSSLSTDKVDALLLKISTLKISDPQIDGTPVLQDLFSGSNPLFKIPSYWKHL